jgi:hypothetical protein
MNRKMMIPVDPIAIKVRMKELGLTYKNIEEASEGEITEMSLKHCLNKGAKVNESMIDTLAGLLMCPKELLVSKDYLAFTNLPFEINAIVNDIYLRNKENINRFYASEIEKFRTKTDLKRMLDETHRLFLTISTADYIFDKTAFVKAFRILEKISVDDNCIANRDITGIQNREANCLYSKISDASGEYNTQQAFLMFLYVFILFDAIFMEEAVASATQLVPERKTEKADQFFELAYKSENMRNTLIEHIMYKMYQFDSPDIAELGIDDTVIEGIVLMLAACEKCYQHIHGDFVNSEYINRAALSAVLVKLKKVFVDIDIPLPEDYALPKYIAMETTRFGIHYNMLKMIFNKLNPPRKPRDTYWGIMIPGTAHLEFDE